MTLYEFKLLDEDKQADEVMEHGVFIADRFTDIYKILLYQLPQIYVEMWYDSQANEITRIRPFISIDQLSPYLKTIDISSVFD